MNVSRPLPSLLPALALLVLTACSREAAQPPQPRPALTQVVGVAGQNDMLWVGEVRARHETDQSFRIGGKVVERKVDIGAVVKKGQPLARLDPVDAGLAAAAANAQSKAAEADFLVAKAEYERQKKLLEKQFISQSAFDSREAQFKAAQARLEQARAQAAVSGNQAGYTDLLAEKDGVVTDVKVEAGQVVAAGQAAIRLALDGEKEVVVAVPEGRLKGVVPGAAAVVRLWAQQDKAYPARVREVAPAADGATRSFQVKVTVLESDAELRLGMTAGVLIGGGELPLLVPTAALTKVEGRNSVWVVHPQSGEVQPRAVETGPYREDGVVVTQGLARGERVVIAGVHKLQPGQVVRPVEPSSVPQPMVGGGTVAVSAVSATAATAGAAAPAIAGAKPVATESAR